MSQSEALKTPAARRSPLLLGKRRRFLVSSDQLKPTLLTCGAALVLLLFVNIALWQASVRGTEEILASAPELARVIQSQDTAERVLIGVASLVFLAGVFVVGILETHRTAGAAFNIRRQLGEVARGRYFTRVRLRDGDNLRGLEAAFNEMAQTLAHRAEQESERLQHLAEDAERGGDGTRIAEKLREMAGRFESSVVPKA